MASIHELLTEQFRAWEQRARGWKVCQQPVFPEPPFVPFTGYELAAAIDDGRKPTFLSNLVRQIAKSPPPPVIPQQIVAEPEPKPLEREPLIELQLSFPARFNSHPRDILPVLTQLADTCEPVAFEIIGTHQRILFQFAMHPDDARSFARLVKAFFPEVTLTESRDALPSQWKTEDDTESFIVEFGLAREFVLPLVTDASETFVGLLSPLVDLARGELGLFQVLFQAIEAPWADHALRAVTDVAGRPVFVNAPELASRVQEKINSPLFAVVVRIAAQAEQFERAFILIRDMATSFRALARGDGNELLPLSNEEYPYEAHVEDVLRRQTRRHGMLLNAHELAAFVHLPSAEARIARLMPELRKTKTAPKTDGGILLGFNEHAGQTTEVRLDAEARSRHMHIIGASGSGKSTLLLNLIRQDIENGEGVAVLDPHGDLVDAVLGMIPEYRIDDVVLLDPADETHCVGFNILQAKSDLDKTLLASDLVSAFQRLSTSWGDQMDSVLQNAIMAFLESSTGGTLADLRRFLLEADFRKSFLATVHDPEVLYYWQKGFPQLSGNRSIGPIITRLNDFLAPKPVRHMVSQMENRLDFAGVMDSGKIFLAKLAQGQIGERNAFLLGSFLIGRFQQTAMSRQAQEVSLRRPFWLYADEFAEFCTPSMAQILSGARKYRLGLILAHHELRQLEREREVASAVLANAHTRICFRLGDDDARKLADGFSFFEARDLQNLNPGEAVCRIERSDRDFNLSVRLPKPTDPAVAATLRQRIVTFSRDKYSRPRADVEAELRQRLEVKSEPKQPPVAEVRKAEVPKTVETTARPVVVRPPTVATPPIPGGAPKQPPTIRDLGKGGEQHKAIQKRLKEAAEKLGFRGTIEKVVLDGQGSVDLLLEREDTTIAVEITVTTTIDHEVGNVVKCLKAGLKSVAVICLSADRLQKIKAAVQGSLGAEQAAQVEFYEPDPFIVYLKGLQPAARCAAETRHGGYKIRRSTPRLSVQEQKQRENTALGLLAESMRRREA